MHARLKSFQCLILAPSPGPDRNLHNMHHAIHSPWHSVLMQFAAMPPVRTNLMEGSCAICIAADTFCQHGSEACVPTGASSTRAGLEHAWARRLAHHGCAAAAPRSLLGLRLPGGGQHRGRGAQSGPARGHSWLSCHARCAHGAVVICSLSLCNHRCAGYGASSAVELSACMQLLLGHRCCLAALGNTCRPVGMLVVQGLSLCDRFRCIEQMHRSP